MCKLSSADCYCLSHLSFSKSVPIPEGGEGGGGEGYRSRFTENKSPFTFHENYGINWYFTLRGK